MKLRAGDNAGGLATIEQSLTTSRDVDTVVFPILLGAATVDPQFSARLSSRMQAGPAWAERLVRWAIANPASLSGLSAFVDDLPESSPALAVGYGQQMVDLLAARGEYDAAFATYAAYAGQAPDRKAIERGLFAPLDWKLTDAFDTGARVFGEDAIEVFVGAGRQGEAARIVTRMPAGATRLDLLASETVGAGAQISLVMNCLSGTSVLPGSEASAPLANGTLKFPIAVPANGCRYQQLTLLLEGGSEEAGAILRRAR